MGCKSSKAKQEEEESHQPGLNSQGNASEAQAQEPQDEREPVCFINGQPVYEDTTDAEVLVTR